MLSLLGEGLQKINNINGIIVITIVMILITFRRNVCNWEKLEKEILHCQRFCCCCLFLTISAMHEHDDVIEFEKFFYWIWFVDR